MKKGAAPRMRQLDHILSECSCLVLSVTKKDGSKGLALGLAQLCIDVGMYKV